MFEIETKRNANGRQKKKTRLGICRAGVGLSEESSIASSRKED